jgi:hypothetical protein
MYRMLVHAHQAEKRVVVFSDGSSRPVAELPPNFQFIEVPSVTHAIDRGAAFRLPHRDSSRCLAFE